MNNRVRRVGTLSAGIVLVGFGIVFLPVSYTHLGIYDGLYIGSAEM